MREIKWKDKVLAQFIKSRDHENNVHIKISRSAKPSAEEGEIGIR